MCWRVEFGVTQITNVSISEFESPGMKCLCTQITFRCDQAPQTCFNATQLGDNKSAFLEGKDEEEKKNLPALFPLASLMTAYKFPRHREYMITFQKTRTNTFGLSHPSLVVFLTGREDLLAQLSAQDKAIAKKMTLNQWIKGPYDIAVTCCPGGNHYDNPPPKGRDKWNLQSGK